MSRVAALGEGSRVRGFALAGASVVVAEGPAQVAAAWQALPDDVGLVVLTPAAAAALGSDAGDRPHVLTAVMP
jgi:vacuolar-type H+-ATPase subunit F/Vma7